MHTLSIWRASRASIAAKSGPHNMTKQCPKCVTVKPVLCFYKNKSRHDGLASVCMPCSKVYQSNSIRSNPASGKEAASLWKATPNGRINNLLHGARTRAAVKGLPCTLTHEWIASRLALGSCEVTGIPFNFSRDGRGSGFKNPFIPSLDQILPNLGYTPENTQIVVWSYNAAKGAGSHEDVLKLAKALCHVE